MRFRVFAITVIRWEGCERARWRAKSPGRKDIGAAMAEVEYCILDAGCIRSYTHVDFLI